MTKTKITGVVRSAEEITGIKGCCSFSGDGFLYSTAMNDLAGQTVELGVAHPAVNAAGGYDYGQVRAIPSLEICWAWKKEWLKDIKEEEVVDWSKVPVDAKIIVGGLFCRHFAMYKGGLVLYFPHGKTSWSDSECGLYHLESTSPDLVEIYKKGAGENG